VILEALGEIPAYRQEPREGVGEPFGVKPDLGEQGVGRWCSRKARGTPRILVEGKGRSNSWADCEPPRPSRFPHHRAGTVFDGDDAIVVERVVIMS